jgi:hypothetical protein
MIDQSNNYIVSRSYSGTAASSRLAYSTTLARLLDRYLELFGVLRESFCCHFDQGSSSACSGLYTTINSHSRHTNCVPQLGHHLKFQLTHPPPRIFPILFSTVNQLYLIRNNTGTAPRFLPLSTAQQSAQPLASAPEPPSFTPQHRQQQLRAVRDDSIQ